MKRNLKDHTKISYLSDEEKRLSNWRLSRLIELGLIGDWDNKNNKLNNDYTKFEMELSKLEIKAMEFIDNYQEVPDEIKNRIFELRKILKGNLKE